MRLLLCILALIAAPMTLAACGAESTIAQTQTATPAQKASLIAALNNMDNAIVSGDADRMKQAMAPESYQIALGEALGVKSSQMPAFLINLENTLDQTFAISTFSSHQIDYDAIEYVSGKNGTPVAIIPFDMEMTVSGQDFTSEGNYYSVLRDGEWLTLSPSDAQTKTLLIKGFPELSTIPVKVSNIQPVTGG